MDERFVCYKDFGARGDGKTNDFFAIKRAHEYANANGLPVLAGSPSDKFLISETELDGYAESIKIKTDTDFGFATIIIDDTDVAWCEGAHKCHNTHVFEIAPDTESIRLDASVIEAINLSGGITNNTRKIDTGLGYAAMLVIYDENSRVFIRYGNNENSGQAKKELILVDKEGNISPETPLLFEYENITKIDAFRLDDRAITVENGFFLSKASKVNLVDKYRTISRGIKLSRSNTTVKNLYHKIEGEIFRGTLVDGVPFVGHSYGDFISLYYANKVLIENVTFQARVYYLQGTYDFGGYMSNGVLLKNCNQSNFFAGDHPTYSLKPAFGKWWGVAGTNFCKNLVYDTCRMTRFDAHEGLVNGKILNSCITDIRLTGAGEMLIENTKIYGDANSNLQLREDYGATWRGTLTVKDTEFLDVCEEQCAFMTCHSSNHYYGYKTYFPNLIIDNVKVSKRIKELPLTYEFEMKRSKAGYFYRSVRDENIAVEGAICADGEPNVNPYQPPEFIKVINNEQNGYELLVPDVPFFKDTKIEGAKRK